jgi:hypothetical protein
MASALFFLFAGLGNRFGDFARLPQKSALQRDFAGRCIYRAVVYLCHARRTVYRRRSDFDLRWRDYGFSCFRHYAAQLRRRQTFKSTSVFIRDWRRSRIDFVNTDIFYFLRRQQQAESIH